MRRIFDRNASAILFDLLATPTNFRRELIGNALRRGLARSCDGRNRPYLNVGHTGLNDPGFRAWLSQANVRPIYLVHDLIPITHPEYCRDGECEKHRERMRTVLDTGAGVIGNSQATLDELSAFARVERRSRPPALATLLGSDALPSHAAGVPAPKRPTFLILGTIEARKNHLMLLQVWRRLVRQLGAEAPQLLVIGQRGWECEQVLDLLDRSELIRDSVTEISRCDDATLATHLAHARALLFPSLAEGYGLPLLEAFRAGVPVIASDQAVFREIAGDIPEYLDPLDAPAWHLAILSYMENESLPRQAQLKRLAGFRPPTWEDHFAAVNSWISTL
jgi:glycosyltransferase involved in cell wall biosynthesis